MHPAGSRSDRPVHGPVLSCFPSCYSPVQRRHLFLRYFNGFFCIQRTSVPCKSPVFFESSLKPRSGLHPYGETRNRSAAAESTAPTGTSVGLALFGAHPKTVASNSSLQLLIYRVSSA